MKNQFLNNKQQTTNNKLKNSFWVFILLLFSFFIIGCSNDETGIISKDESKTNTNINAQIEIEHLNLESLNNDSNIIDGLEKFKKFLDVNKSNINLSRTSESDSNLSFTISTDDILKIESDNTKTLSFYIEEPTLESSLFENFVMEIKNDGNYKFYIFRYTQSEEESQEFPYDIAFDEISEDQLDLDKIFKTDDRILMVGGTCFDVVSVCSPRNFECSWIVSSFFYCGGGGGSGGSSGSTGGSGSSGSGGNGGNGSGGPGGSAGDGAGGSSGNSNDSPIVPINDRLPIELEIAECLESNNGLGEENEMILMEWLQQASSLDKFKAQSYLNSPAIGEKSFLYGGDSNCKSVSGQDFFFEGLKADLNGGDFDIVNKIILDSSFVANETLKCVYDKLVKDNSSLFKETVGAFIDDPEFNLTFKIGECVRTDDQCTDDSNPYNIIITFEDVNLSPVEMAAALLHESIHAELARFVERYVTGKDVNNRPQLFDHYTHYAPLYGEYSGHIDHIYMTQKYIIPICEALRRFDNNNHSQIYYTSFAWVGLRFWDALKLLDTDPLADEYDAYKLIVNENSTVCE